MSTLLERLHPKHFASGWPVFWRIHLPFFVSLGHLGLAAVLGLEGHQHGTERLIQRWPGFDAPMIVSLFLWGAAAYLLLWPILVGVRRWVAKRLDSDFWEAQFSLLNALKKILRWVSMLMLVFVLFSIQEVWVWHAPGRRVALVVCAVALGTVWVVSIGLYGWFADQWHELKVRGQR